MTAQTDVSAKSADRGGVLETETLRPRTARSIRRAKRRANRQARRAQTARAAQSRRIRLFPRRSAASAELEGGAQQQAAPAVIGAAALVEPAEVLFDSLRFEHTRSAANEAATVTAAQPTSAPGPIPLSSSESAPIAAAPAASNATLALSTLPGGGFERVSAPARTDAPRRRSERQLSPRASRRAVERAFRAPAKPVHTVAVTTANRPKRLGTSLMSIAAVASFVLVGALPQLGGTTSVAQAEAQPPLQLAAAEENDQTLGIESAPEIALGRDAISVTRTYAAYTMSWGSYTPNITAGIQWPIPFTAPITAGYGYRARTGSFHYGLDFTPGAGQPIVAMAEGTVTFAGYRGAYGNLVIINHPQLGVSSWYAHQANGSIAVKAGDSVKAGMLVGRVGSTGRSSGAHLHFEIHNSGGAIDPYKWLKANAG